MHRVSDMLSHCVLGFKMDVQSQLSFQQIWQILVPIYLNLEFVCVQHHPCSWPGLQILRPLQKLFSPSVKPHGLQQLRHSVALWKGLCLWRGLLKSLRQGQIDLAQGCAAASALQMDCWKARRLFALGSRMCPQYPDLAYMGGRPPHP